MAHYYCWDTTNGVPAQHTALDAVAHDENVRTYATRNGASKKLRILREQAGTCPGSTPVPTEVLFDGEPGLTKEDHQQIKRMVNQVARKSYRDLMIEHGCAACVNRHASTCQCPPMDQVFRAKNDVSEYVENSLKSGSPLLRPSWCPWPPQGNAGMFGWFLPSELKWKSDAEEWEKTAESYRSLLVRLNKLILGNGSKLPSPLKVFEHLMGLWEKIASEVNSFA